MAAFFSTLSKYFKLKLRMFKIDTLNVMLIKLILKTQKIKKIYDTVFR